MRLVGWCAWVALAISVAGCGKTRTPPGESPAAGGSAGSSATMAERLVPWRLEATGTAPLVVGIFDTQEQAHCRFLPDAQGQLRCLPLTVTYLEVTVDFADASCEEPIFNTFLQGAPAVLGRPVTVPLPPDGCEQRYAVGTLTPVPDDMAPRYFAAFDGTCRVREDGGVPVIPVASFTLSERLPLERYVSGTVARGPLLEGRVRLQEVEAADGTRFQHGLVDEHWDQPCSLSELRESLSCLPASLSDNTNYFVDSECQGEVLYRVPECAEPAYIGDYGDLYALGELWSGAVFELGKGCREVTVSPPAETSFMTQGAPLGLDATVALAWGQSGSEQLSLLGLSTSDGAFVALSDWLLDTGSFPLRSLTTPRPRYHDNALDLHCTPVWTFESEVRCVPRSAQIDPYDYQMYVDADCSKPAYLCLSQVPCADRDVVLMDYDENGEYRARSRNRAVAVAGAYFAKSLDACQLQTGFDGQLFESSETLPWDDYPLLDELNGRRSGQP